MIALLGGVGCHRWVSVPAAEVPGLVSSLGPEAVVRDDGGETVRIDRAQVGAVRLRAREGQRLAVVAAGQAPGTGYIVAVPESTEIAWGAQGWMPVPIFVEPVHMEVHGSALTVGDANSVHTVALGDLRVVEVQQPSHRVVWIVGGSALGLGVLVGAVALISRNLYPSP